MSDDVDRASELEEKQREQALLLRKPTLKAVGVCWYCGEPLISGRLFCDVSCRDAYQEEQAAKKRNGQ